MPLSIERISSARSAVSPCGPKIALIAAPGANLFPAMAPIEST